MNPQLLNLIAAFGVMQYAKKLDFEDPQVVMYARTAYVVSNAVIFGIYAIIKSKIETKNDRTPLVYEEPPIPFSGEKTGKSVATTVMDYDLEQLGRARKSTIFGIMVMAFMHLYLHYSQPLVLQSILPLITVLTNNLVSIHLFGKPAEGSLARPFAVPSLFGNNNNQRTAVTGASTAAAPAAETKKVEEKEAGAKITELN
ncbi:pho88 family protein [Schizosaccharomyces japonicus yFS275]|uniref:Pho88 family protein n=1 Tax=Schizosaccharomyces japonicus (strain yFS275 / FY16936) TaxID=402676 RepID=B6JYW1_SCHJY|nr:pho88 family protein [Schizosaccharomyces japonicus yFS275]EEB06729.1 pho88 family protein [Schizosaccharomyces japonicus yFS275]